MKTTFLPRVALLAATTAVIGCSGVVIHERAGGLNGYDTRDFDYANRKGAIETVIAGNPFGGDKAAFDGRVRALMQGENRGLPAKFAAAQGADTDPLYKTVVAFDLPAGIETDRLCREGAGLPSRKRAGALRVAMVFCEGGTAKASVSGSVDGAAGPDHPAFARLVKEATYFLVPDDGWIDQLKETND